MKAGDLEDDQIVEQQFAHPCIIDDMVLATILKGILYDEHKWFFGDPKQVPVFFGKEVTQLAPALADALAKADSNQRIRFKSHNMGGGLLFAARRENEGVIFIKPQNKLNIAFNMINEELDASDDVETTSYRSRKDPLRILTSNTPLHPRGWYTIHISEEDSKPNTMWAVVDISKPPVDLPPEIVVLKDKPDVEEVIVIPADVPVDVPPAKEKGSDEGENLRKSLEFLKELFEAGLISEKDYEMKKKELLDGIR